MPVWKRFILRFYNPVALKIKLGAAWMQAALTGPWTRCCVCGKFGPKRFVKQAVADDLVEMWRLSADEAKNLRIKESMNCPWCGSKTRSRCLAETFLGLIKNDGSDQPQSVKIAATGKLPRTLILNQDDVVIIVEEAEEAA